MSRSNRNGLLGRCAIPALILAVGSAALPSYAAGNARASAKLSDYVVSGLKDFSETAIVAFHDDKALAKISRDFGMAYRLSGDIHVRFMEPCRLRMDGKLGGGSAIYIVNRDTQYVRLSIGLKQKVGWHDEPGKRKTLLDFGLISGDYLTWTNSQFLGMRPVNGVQCAEFRLKYKIEDGTHRFIWVDPKTRCVLRREEYNRFGKLFATYYFRDPKEVAPGIWFPTRAEVFNSEEERAGEMDYRNVKINEGLTDAEFVL